MTSGEQKVGWPGAPSKERTGHADVERPKAWVEPAVPTQEECHATGCQPAELCYGTKGLFCFIVKMQYLLLKYSWELKGACMNHKYLHAINVWTKELDRLSWENVFSHEKRCFELQSRFNFSSSIANLKSQCLLGITLSGPQSSRRLGRMGGSGGSFLMPASEHSACGPHCLS